MHQTTRTLTTLAGVALAFTALGAGLATSCAHSPRAVDEHDHGPPSPGAATNSRSTVTTTTTTTTAAPPGATDAADRLAKSPRHGEWAMIKVGASDSVRAWVVYPERSTKAPVVVLIHDIFGMGNWIRAMADQAAADGFIAIAPDLLTGHVAAVGDSVDATQARGAIGQLDQAEIQRRINGVADWGMALPAATRRYGITGFCWGGGITWAHVAAAADRPTLGAAVPFYGPVSPAVRAGLEHAKTPTLAMYAENDARVNAMIPATDSAFAAAGARLEKEVFPGAGHGFVRGQEGQNGANREAALKAWPRTIAWFRQNLEGR
jgi:carboxymethylenebutenolidase